MKSKMCKGCRCFWPKGSTAFNYDVCNFKFASVAVQRLKECPNGKPIYGLFLASIEGPKEDDFSECTYHYPLEKRNCEFCTAWCWRRQNEESATIYNNRKDELKPKPIE